MNFFYSYKDFSRNKIYDIGSFDKSKSLKNVSEILSKINEFFIYLGISKVFGETDFFRDREFFRSILLFDHFSRSKRLIRRVWKFWKANLERFEQTTYELPNFFYVNLTAKSLVVFIQTFLLAVLLLICIEVSHFWAYFVKVLEKRSNCRQKTR